MNIRTIASKITLTQKIIAGLVFTVTTAYGGINFIYKKAVEKVQEDSKSYAIEQDVKDTKMATDSILTILTDQGVLLNKVIEKQDEQKEAYNGLRATVLDHISKDKSMTIEQFKQYMEATPELKKADAYVPQTKIREANKREVDSLKKIK